MNPDKLFDYLDGKLAPAEREQLEEKLMSDEQLRRQFNIAREIHRGGGITREVILPGEDDPAAVQRSGILTRRIATAAVVLVFVNVFVGIVVIAGKNRKKSDPTTSEASIRQQLATSLGAAAQNVLPPPTFVSGELEITAPRADWENVVARIMAAAVALGGSAAKGLPAENSLNVVADVPSSREEEFRQAVTSGTGTPPPAAEKAAEAPEPNKRSIVQIRIAEAAQ